MMVVRVLFTAAAFFITHGIVLVQAWANDPLLTGSSGRIKNAAVYVIADNPGFQYFTTNFVEPLIGAYEIGKVFDFDEEDTSDVKSEFLKNLTFSLNKGRTVDLFILGHTNSYSKMLAGIPRDLRKKIRLVYNSGCYNVDDGPNLLSSYGIQAYVGHFGFSASPLFLNKFIYNWLGSYYLRAAVARTNLALAKAMIFGESSDLMEWGYNGIFFKMMSSSNGLKDRVYNYMGTEAAYAGCGTVHVLSHLYPEKCNSVIPNFKEILQNRNQYTQDLLRALQGDKNVSPAILKQIKKWKKSMDQDALLM